MVNNPYILAIESSCDDTSAAVLHGRRVLSNVIASQSIHNLYGGVVPELASRAHQINIVPVVDFALKKSGIPIHKLHAIAFTRGPGLQGSLLVGASLAKSLAQALGLPLIGVNHLHGHLLAHMVSEDVGGSAADVFPQLCLLVSGGHTQLVMVHDYLNYEVLGRTIDDAAGEAFDKCAKVMGLDYPGGPVVDRLASKGNENAFSFGLPKIEGLNYSFSGLKTSFLYTLRDLSKNDAAFVQNNLNDLCASLQKAIIDVLMSKLKRAIRETGVRTIAVSGGVAANSQLRSGLTTLAAKQDLKLFLPELAFTTDNAAMIGMVAYYHYLTRKFNAFDVITDARLDIGDF